MALLLCLFPPKVGRFIIIIKIRLFSLFFPSTNSMLFITIQILQETSNARLSIEDVEKPKYQKNFVSSNVSKPGLLLSSFSLDPLLESEA